MDTFCEQLVRISKGPKFYLGVTGIWLVAIVISFFSFKIPFLAAFIIVGVGYGAYYLCGYLSVEYEYIITNGTFDVDIIYAKRNRKRIFSFELSDVESIEKLGGATIDKKRYKNAVIACDGGEDAYKLIVSGDTGTSLVVIAPNEKTRTEIVKFVPKFVGNTAFK